MHYRTSCTTRERGGQSFPPRPDIRSKPDQCRSFVGTLGYSPRIRPVRCTEKLRRFRRDVHHHVVKPIVASTNGSDLRHLIPVRHTILSVAIRNTYERLGPAGIRPCRITAASDHCSE